MPVDVDGDLLEFLRTARTTKHLKLLLESQVCTDLFVPHTHFSTLCPPGQELNASHPPVL